MFWTGVYGCPFTFSGCRQRILQGSGNTAYHCKLNNYIWLSYVRVHLLHVPCTTLVYQDTSYGQQLNEMMPRRVHFLLTLSGEEKEEGEEEIEFWDVWGKGGRFLRDMEEQPEGGGVQVLTQERCSGIVDSITL